MDVKVAAVQLTREALFSGPLAVTAGLDPALDWPARFRTRLDVDEDVAIVDILDRGAAQLGLSVRASDVWSRDTVPSDALHRLFFSGDGGQGIVQLEAVVLDDGAAQWWFDSRAVRLRDARRAKQSGLFRGDPSRLVIVVDEPPPGVGNGLDLWFEILRVLPEIQQLVKSTTDATAPWISMGAITLGAWKAVKKVWTRWDSTGGDLVRYQQLFNLPRTTSQIAVLLRVSEDEVRPLLPFLGLEEHRDGYWRASNRPGRKQLAELAVVANVAAHMHLSPGPLRDGLQEVLGLAVGERAKRAEGIFRRLQLAAYELEPADEIYVTRSESGELDDFEVVEFRDYDRVVLGIARALDKGEYAVLDPSGRQRVNRDGSDLVFPTLDAAAAFIQVHPGQ